MEASKETEPRKVSEFADYFETAGKALSALAGLAILIYLIGGFSVLIRLHRLDLPAEAILPKIPNERLALLGLTQLLWSLALAAVIIVIAVKVLPARERGQKWEEWRDSLKPTESWARAAAVVVALLILVAVTPWSVNGAVYLVLILAALAFFMATARALHPVITVLVALALASALTALREIEFPTPFPTAQVTVSKEIQKSIPEAADGAFWVRVIESTDSEMILAYESPEQEADELRDNVRLPPNLLVLQRDQVTRIRYARPLDPQSHSDSVLQWLVGGPFPMCFATLICEFDSNPGGKSEQGEPVFTLPFFF